MGTIQITEKTEINKLNSKEFNVLSLNSAQKKYSHLRQESKAPTFLLTYGGTYHGMMKNLGWPEDKSKSIESAYHDMYQVSDAWVQSKLKDAHNKGYVEVAFGMRVRTPLLAQTMYGTSGLPYEAQAEQRTAGNALGQSWGLLNNRAAIELRERLMQSEFKHDILPISHIHDSQYFLVKDNPKAVKWLNDNLIECMEWNDHPEIYHPEVGLGGELSIFWPSWEHELKLPNKASEEEIATLCKEHKDYLKEEGII